MQGLPVQVDKECTAPAMPLRRAGKWFLQSGIQEPSGGVARYRLNAENRNLPISTEITGYAVSAFTYLAQVTSDDAYSRAARRAADFLIDQAWNKQLETFPFECAPGAPAYFFDCGIIIRGLLAVHRLTGDARYLDVAARAGRSMARDFLTPTAIHPIISVPDRQPWPYEKRWSREPGCFLLKSALAWLNLFRATGERLFETWWEQALQQSLASWDSFLPGTGERLKIMDRLHAHCYFLEALLAVPHRPECAETLRLGIARTSTYLRDIAPDFARSDVYAQLLRVRLHADALGCEPLDRSSAREEAAAIASFQYDSGDPHLDGGYAFGRRGTDWLPFVNPVSTSFCLQALEQWRQYEAGQFEANLDALI
jgi:hypothetical protein